MCVCVCVCVYIYMYIYIIYIYVCVCVYHLTIPPPRTQHGFAPFCQNKKRRTTEHILLNIYTFKYAYR